ncbi:polysaccharide pyruvyl transferase family protein [Bacteroides sp. GD17]|jgi:coenzyme F420-reducing hydrogenase beta subunit|uniref:polysaccharide pyruvyl transferase family protein n=1 Tax=Bacteroides sp. GD17 TaxID=3139826 RepID=UPI0025DEA918|nr:polysaccharide pyruvyl transferase family protein [uncultured Bacteroides sp.]
MPLLADSEHCTGCMCCANSCKQGAITIAEDKNGLWHPVVDVQKCTECHLCEKHCGEVYNGIFLSRNPIHQYTPYTAWNTNPDQRSQSTSGGVFASLSSVILNKGGIVCGAAIGNNRVQHIFITSLEELPRIQGVKYIQSNLTGIYQQVRTYLDAQQMVLFSGTPCQVAALYAYLGKKRDNANLYTAEVICHGVVSNLILDKHLEYNHANQIVSFRSKSLGWGKDTYITAIKEGKKMILQNRHKNFFYHAFTSDTVTRPSCYQCRYATIERVADLTMGDYWGSKQSQEEASKGLSLLIVNNAHGQQLFEKCTNLHTEATDWEMCLPRNPRLYCDKHECRGISITTHLHTLFTYMPHFVAQSIAGPHITKRNPLAYLRARYVIKQKKVIDQKVETELKKALEKINKTKRMKKVGILTYHRSINYGAMLQAYALRYTVQKLAHEAEVIDYGKIGQEKIFFWSTFSLKAIAGSIVNNFLRLFGERQRMATFNKFAEEVIGISQKHYSTKDELTADLHHYKSLITGSDQVWHPVICEDDMSYFLDFPMADNQKIAYAPSFGVKQLTSEQQKKYTPFLQHIGHLSVREEAGVQILKKILNKEVPLVADPTLLCDATEWNEIAIAPARKKKYILFFTILGDPEGSAEFVSSLSRKFNYEIVKIGSIRDLANCRYHSGRAAGPREFLGLVREAEFVVTNSFHGTAFSIIYRKNFFTFLNKNDRNSRLESITQVLGLEAQLKKGKCALPENLTVDYTQAKERLALLKKQSLSFLENSLNS